VSAQDGMQSTPLRWHFAARLMLAVGQPKQKGSKEQEHAKSGRFQSRVGGW